MNRKEIIFPLRKRNKNNLKREKEISSKVEVYKRLNRFYTQSERLREEEWHQEYFLIYNSYVIENS